jgi:hypothetical protein
VAYDSFSEHRTEHEREASPGKRVAPDPFLDFRRAIDVREPRKRWHPQGMDLPKPDK